MSSPLGNCPTTYLLESNLRKQPSSLARNTSYGSKLFILLKAIYEEATNSFWPKETLQLILSGPEILCCGSSLAYLPETITAAKNQTLLQRRTRHTTTFSLSSGVALVSRHLPNKVPQEGPHQSLWSLHCVFLQSSCLPKLRRTNSPTASSPRGVLRPASGRSRLCLRALVAKSLRQVVSLRSSGHTPGLRATKRKLPH